MVTLEIISLAGLMVLAAATTILFIISLGEKEDEN